MPPFEDPLDALQYVAGAVETRRTAEDIRHRRKLITKVQGFTLGWIVVVLLLVAGSALGSDHFHLANGVLIALLTTTTANVLGLAFIVLRGMFHQKAPDHTRGSTDRRAEGSK